MPYFRVDDGFNTHPKVLAIPRRDRVATIGLWAMAGVHCAHHLTDGRLAKHMVEELGSAKKYADHLVRVGLWTDDGDTYLIHQFVAWQGASRDDVLTKREAEAERKRRWRAEKDAERAARHSGTDAPVPPMSQRDNPGTDTGTTPSVPPSVPPMSAPRPALPTLPSPSLPSPTHPSVPFGDGEDGSPWGGDVQQADARASNAPTPDEPPRCLRHAGLPPGAEPPCGACGRLRVQWETRRATAAADADRPPPRPPWCGTCDPHSRLTETDTGMARCPTCHPLTHQESA